MKKRDYINVLNLANISSMLSNLDHVLTSENSIPNNSANISMDEITEIRVQLKELQSRLFKSIEYKD